jgi:anionic cell wall polymer biosynthesis LytR-Cps2A-Psr (LCP) family protein
MQKNSLRSKGFARQIKARMPKYILDNLNKLARLWRTKSTTPNKIQLKQGWIQRGLIAILFLLGLLIVALPIFYYQSIVLSKLSLDDAVSPPAAVSDRSNILLLGYEKSNDYYFVNFIAVARIDPRDSSVKVMLVHPDLAIRSKLGYEKLRNALAQIQLNQPQGHLRAFVAEVEVMLGMQIDRYFAVESSQMAKNWKMLNVNYAAEYDVNDPDIGKITKGQQLGAQELSGYLAANAAASLDNRMLRQGEFLDFLLRSQRTPLSLAFVLWGLPEASKHFTTDTTRVELFELINQLWRVTNWKIEFIKVADTFYIDEDKQQYYVPNARATDDKVAKLIANSAVLKEQARIEIYNATGVSGLAVKTRRWLQNLGANVVRAGNYPERLDQTVLYDPSGIYPENVDLIKGITRGEVEILDEAFPFNHTGELILILGADVV